ncbi:phosphatidylinositol 4,5-bisphosphate 3-kinase catalytic subunit gamma isoform [Megalops cyprinoides]|uniref:phosphatidylinositol 4,5-bisphosphate 3-kinase catalytic subunit gamma isoform n=1 Tax=Megalops cyprinoides TaxID=118141 RepID=UPI0018642D0A|nr:phosphatidylinositol 4,5-bisphosphate 3-kinase catalytic subunit gamma isoform [Megalops cyprinoides]
MEQNAGYNQRQTSGGYSSLFEGELLRPSGTDNILVFICTLQERPIDARRDLQPEEGQASIQVQLPARCNVNQLRLHICMQVQMKNYLPDPLRTLDPEKYQLLYIKGGNWYEIYDDCQVLRTLDVEWRQNARGVRMSRIFVAPQREDTEDTQSAQQFLTYLIGHDLSSAAADRLDELNFIRRKFATPRREELQRRDPRAYALEPWTTTAPFLKDQQSQLTRDLLVTFYYKDICLSAKVDITTPACTLMEVFQKMMSENSHNLEYQADNLVLKVCRREEFVSGQSPLSDFLWVRQCLKTMQGLHLSVLLLTSLKKDTVRTEDWPLVDSFTGLSSSHEELTLTKKDVDDILMISLWDCRRNFRVKLLGIDIPQLPSKAPQNIIIEVSILYGNKVVSTICSTPKTFTEEVLWNTWLEFDIPLKTLPRGSRLGFTINSSTLESTTKESKSTGGKATDFQKGKGKALYFVNLLLIDHRSVLRQGLHTLHMWPFPEQEEEVFTYEADKLSSATNPDQANSMAVTFLLDRYSFPVVLPHSTSSPGVSSSRKGSDADKVGKEGIASPVSPLSSDTVLRRLKEKSEHYGSNLPQFLRAVNWLKFEDVQDVHWLLRNWDPSDLDVPVALELLSVDFADEQVRKLAVQRLENLSNDEVLKYLLQLVQTLKVEPYHDSFLARFLIQRALRSKRIGHYLFWYLRSEVTGGPYFRQRLAVVLEAYLLGCGQAMLDSFLRQVQLVECLNKVAIDIKRLFPDKSDLPPTAASLLQDMLKNSNLPADFQVPFDPRIRAGPILLEKCKVMASKKKPLWLEFSSTDSQGPPVPPVGIIFKHGDDLRQDMLVIQTLMIMDSIWQEKSLDLNLVPYGCISTGHNIGMIEIVRNAVTIAAVQRSRGGTTGAFKNEALFEWLKSRSLLQEIHYQTMERFVTSCAGYCVATYVLGIGDRHNDNIMIMEQGNLFHIDFGHIMGNTKRFLGVNRERVPFVLTPDFLYVMGRVGKKSSLYFHRFTHTCIQAYLALRCHSRLLVTLFSLMLLTGIPELSCAQDMVYLREALQEERSEEEAGNHFLQQINMCEQLNWTVQTNWWIHMVAGIKG